jgi:ketosteroid isomerase-like protein
LAVRGDQEEHRMGTNAAVVQSAYDAFGRGDIGAVLDMLDDAVEWSSPATLPQGGEFHGKAGVGEFFQRVGDAWTQLGLEIESVSEAENDLVIGVVQASGIREDGTPGGYGATHVFTVRDDKIVRYREYTDLDVSIA